MLLAMNKVRFIALQMYSTILMKGMPYVSYPNLYLFVTRRFVPGVLKEG